MLILAEICPSYGNKESLSCCILGCGWLLLCAIAQQVTQGRCRAHGQRLFQHRCEGVYPLHAPVLEGGFLTLPCDVPLQEPIYCQLHDRKDCQLVTQR